MYKSESHVKVSDIPFSLRVFRYGSLQYSNPINCHNYTYTLLVHIVITASVSNNCTVKPHTARIALGPRALDGPVHLNSRPKVELQ